MEIDDSLDSHLRLPRGVDSRLLGTEMWANGRQLISERFTVLGMPTGYLIDKSGTVRWVHAGFKKSDGLVLRDQILKLIEEN